MKVYYLRCPSCGALLGTVDHRQDVLDSKCFWTILAGANTRPGVKETKTVTCAGCNTTLKVYFSKTKPFALRKK